MIDAEVRALAVAALDGARAAGRMIATAESCTGGLVAAALTAIPGSSDVVDRGFVTYSNAAKREMLGVGADVLEAFGAVSEPVARAMALGALERSRADVAVAITGVAGPGGGSADKPVGRVVFARASRGEDAALAVTRDFGDLGRDEIRRQAVICALGLLMADASGSAHGPAV